MRKFVIAAMITLIASACLPFNISSHSWSPEHQIQLEENCLTDKVIADDGSAWCFVPSDFYPTTKPGEKPHYQKPEELKKLDDELPIRNYYSTGQTGL